MPDASSENRKRGRRDLQDEVTEPSKQRKTESEPTMGLLGFLG